MSDQLYCPECAAKWSGAYNTDHRCVTCGSPLKAEAGDGVLDPVKAERDALAAHVARLRGLGQLVREAATDLAHIGTVELFDRAEKWDAALNDEPTTSLAHLKAQWQAEALESVAVRYGHNSQYPQYCMHCILESEAGQLRHQSQEKT